MALVKIYDAGELAAAPLAKILPVGGAKSFIVFNRSKWWMVLEVGGQLRGLIRGWNQRGFNVGPMDKTFRLLAMRDVNTYIADFDITGMTLGVWMETKMEVMSAPEESNIVAGTIPLSGSVVGIDQTTPGTTNGVQVVAALPAGTNNIGDVDLASAIPAGTNIVGQVGIDQTTPGTTNGVQVVAALPAGANTVGNATQYYANWAVNRQTLVATTDTLFDFVTQHKVVEVENMSATDDAYVKLDGIATVDGADCIMVKAGMAKTIPSPCTVLHGISAGTPKVQVTAYK